MELQILYEDNAIIVCKKPAGVATQTKRLGQADMESRPISEWCTGLTSQ